MPKSNPRLLKVFLCHASVDKSEVRELYQRLRSDSFAPWLDEEDLLAGQDFNYEITKAVRESDAVIVCLSRDSITRKGYVQREIKFALDVAEEQPEGAIFIIPARLEDCEVPEKLRRWLWIDLYETNGYERLVRSLKRRASDLGIDGIQSKNASLKVDRIEGLFDEDIVLEAGAHMALPFEIEEGKYMSMDLISSAPVDVLIMEYSCYQDWVNNIPMDTLLSLLYKEYLSKTELHTTYLTHKWRSYFLVVRNELVNKVTVQLKVECQI